MGGRRNLLRPVELFEQHAADEEMRPSHRPQRQYRRGAVEDSGPEPLGTADRKRQLRHSAVAPDGEMVGEFAARPRGTARVEGDQRRSGRQCLKNQLGLARLHQRRRQALFDVELDDRRRRRDPPGVERLELL